MVEKKQRIHEEIKWIIKESKEHGGVNSFTNVLRPDVKDICVPKRAARDCSDLHKTEEGSGVYTIYPDQSTSSKGVKAYCDMQTDGGGWTVIQKRIDGSENFQRGWTEYENGFGNVNREYWLGNKNIHILTSNGRYQLRVDLEYANGKNKYAIYNTFIVGGAASKYNLTVGGYSGNAGDKLSAHNGYKFTTMDQDNDIWPKNCAAVYSGAWWFYNCYASTLNAKFQGKMYWANNCKRAAMMIRKL